MTTPPQAPDTRPPSDPAHDPEPDAIGVPGETADDLATRWLEAEARARNEPANMAIAAEAARLGDAYDLAVTTASQEELRLAWEAAQRAQQTKEIGTPEWADARRVSELLRTEYTAIRLRETPG